MAQLRIILRGDGGQEHTQGIVDADKYADVQLVERDGNRYIYRSFSFENGMMIAFYDKIDEPVLITDF